MSFAVATSKQGMFPALAERCLLQTLQKAVLKRRACHLLSLQRPLFKVSPTLATCCLSSMSEPAPGSDAASSSIPAAAPVTPSITTPPSVKGSQSVASQLPVQTWRLCLVPRCTALSTAPQSLSQTLLDLRPSCDPAQLCDPILHCSRSVTRGDDRPSRMLIQKVRDATRQQSLCLYCVDRRITVKGRASHLQAAGARMASVEQMPENLLLRVPASLCHLASRSPKASQNVRSC